MKNFLIALFLPFSLFGQKRDSVRIQTPIFHVIYSEKLEQPLWIQYKVACPNGKASRAGLDFYTNDTVFTSDHNDYANNIYDKGHLAPAASFNCSREMLISTFSYLNCVLQNQYLNRGLWRILELQERNLALEQQVLVTIEVVFDRNCQKLPTGATVPKAFKKTIFLPKSGKRSVYFFPNEAPSSKDLNNYLLKE